MTERREKIIKKLIFAYSISGCTVLFLEQNCSYVPNVLAFGIPHERGFLAFGVLNAKYLRTPNENALRASTADVPNAKYLTHQTPKNPFIRCSKSHNFCHMWTVPFHFGMARTRMLKKKKRVFYSFFFHPFWLSLFSLFHFFFHFSTVVVVVVFDDDDKRS